MDEVNLPMFCQTAELGRREYVRLSDSMDYNLVNQQSPGTLELVFLRKTIDKTNSGRRVAEQSNAIFRVTESTVNSVKAISPHEMFAEFRFVQTVSRRRDIRCGRI